MRAGGPPVIFADAGILWPAPYDHRATKGNAIRRIGRRETIIRVVAHAGKVTTLSADIDGEAE